MWNPEHINNALLEERAGKLESEEFKQVCKVSTPWIVSSYLTPVYRSWTNSNFLITLLECNEEVEFLGRAWYIIVLLI